MGAAAKGIDEQKKNKKSLNAGIVDPIKDLPRNRMMLLELLADIHMKKEGDSQAERCRLSYLSETDLTKLMASPVRTRK